MKKFMNEPDTLLAESLDGFAAAHAGLVVIGPENKFVRRARLGARQSGPDFRRRQRPRTAARRVRRTRHAGRGLPRPGLHLADPGSDGGGRRGRRRRAGVLFIVKNYAGDRMNFEMAAEIVAGPVETVITDDDVAVEDSTCSAGRRGVAGTLIVEKIIGAAAEAGRDLAALKASASGSTAARGRWASR